MDNFFIYLEKVLSEAIFFSSNEIASDLQKSMTSEESEKKSVETIKNDRLKKGEIYFNDRDIEEIVFNFKIDNMIYELVFNKSSDSNSKMTRKLMNNFRMDPKTKGRYGISFYKLGGPKYVNVKLTPTQSVNLFDHILTCAYHPSIKNKNFFFDGAMTDKEVRVSDMIENLISEIIKVKKIKDKQKIYEFFLNKLDELKIKLHFSVLNKIKNIFDKDKFDKIIKKIAFILRDELNINVNTREKLFIRVLKKEGIKYTIGKIYTRTIFFDI